ncbi:MAG: hypothetical protein ACJ75S_09425 [Solirubrobacterales bacterium]
MSRSRWFLVPVLSAIVPILLLAAGLATGAADVTKVRSTVTIKSGEGAEFTGKVSAAQKRCRSGRKVKLFMEPYSGGADELVGTAKTNASGAWKMEGSFLAGIYHAQVTAATVHAGNDTLRCQVDVSVSARF